MEHDNSVAVYLLLEPAGQREHPFVEVGQVALQQEGGFAVGDALGRFGLVQYVLYQGAVVPVGPRVFHRLYYFAVVDELFGYFGFYVVHLVFSIS